MSGTVAALQFVLLGRRSAGDDAGGGNRGVITSIALPMPQPRPLTHVFNFHFQRLLLLIILLQEKKNFNFDIRHLLEIIDVHFDPSKLTQIASTSWCYKATP